MPEQLEPTEPTHSELPILPKLDARLPKWDLGELIERHCPSCGAENKAKLLRPDRLPLSNCVDCGLWYVSRIPRGDAIMSLYQGYWHNHRPSDLCSETALHIRESAKALVDESLKVQRLLVLAGSLAGKLIVEVGAGTGNLLVALQSLGAEVIANEISVEAATFLSEELKIEVVAEELDPANWIHASPDIILMNDLIEHPIEPFLLLQNAITLLKAGGLLAIWTPNGGGAGRSVESAQQWVGFRVDLEHLQYFSPRTVQTIAERWGLEIEHLETTGYPGLDGITTLPVRQARSPNKKAFEGIKHHLKRAFPWLPRIRRWLAPSIPRRELGNYHLYAILRKR